MHRSEELRSLRGRALALAERLARLEADPPPATRRLLARVYDAGAIPTTVPRVFATHPVLIRPGASEGAAATASVDTGRTAFVRAVGPGVPVAGDDLVVRAVDYRWEADREGSGGGGPFVTIPGCPCSRVPTTLTQTSSAPLSNDQILQSCTLQYGPTPGALALLGIGANSFLSTATFTDIATGDQFYYYLYCALGYYVITRVYETSAYGSPYRDAVRYRWLIGFGGNTCTPFMLVNGQIFPGGDPTCVVTITA